MKKKLLFMGVLAIGLANAQAQTGRDNPQHTNATKRVGINTENPVATLEILKSTDVPASQVQGFLLPHLSQAERGAMDREALVHGIMIFNTDKKCIDWWDGYYWQCVDGSQKDLHDGTLPPAVTLTLPPGITIADGQHTIVSIYDTDYLPYTIPTSPASWSNATNIAADGTPESTIIDVPGKIPAEGITVAIPVTTTSMGKLPAYRVSATIPAERTEDNKEAIVTFSWEQQNFTQGTTHILAKLTPENGSDILVKKLDIVGGMGNDYQGLELATFAVPKSSTDTGGSYSGKYQIRAISAIPDKHFGKDDSGLGVKSHDLLYLTVKGPDGKLWLNNNLGADYANMNSHHFSPTSQAGAFSDAGPVLFPTAEQIKRDYRAYGSQYVPNADSDGYEIIFWLGSNTGRRIGDTIPDNPNGYQKENDPCPLGWHIPTVEELKNVHDILVGQTTTLDELGTNQVITKALWQENSLRLPAAGYIDNIKYDEPFVTFSGVIGSYLTSTPGFGSVGPQFTYSMNFFKLGSYFYAPTKMASHSVRCIKD